MEGCVVFLIPPLPRNVVIPKSNCIEVKCIQKNFNCKTVEIHENLPLSSKWKGNSRRPIKFTVEAIIWSNLLGNNNIEAIKSEIISILREASTDAV